MFVLSGTGIENEEIGGNPENFDFLCYLVAPGAISGLLAAENPRKSAEFCEFAANSRPCGMHVYGPVIDKCIHLEPIPIPPKTPTNQWQMLWGK